MSKQPQHLATFLTKPKIGSFKSSMVVIPMLAKVHKMSSFPFCSLSTSRLSSAFWHITAQPGSTGQITTRVLISDWARRHVNDPYVKQSIKDGYRCRSAYKLLQIQQKFKILKPGLSVMECGCSPGSWSQVAAKLVNAGGAYDPNAAKGSLVGCDLLHVEQVPGSHLFSKLDFTDIESQKVLVQVLEQKTFDVVLSDMAPNASGVKSLDSDRLIKMALQVNDFALKHGSPGSSMVIKIWQGSLMEYLLSKLNMNFSKVSTFKPKASRSDSSEIYVIAQHLSSRKNS